MQTYLGFRNSHRGRLVRTKCHYYEPVEGKTKLEMPEIRKITTNMKDIIKMTNMIEFD